MNTGATDERPVTLGRRIHRLGLTAALLATAIASPTPAGAHGMVGQRFFPATLTFDDPFVADELSLPTVQSVRRKSAAGELAGWETEISAELSKRLSRDFGLSMAGTLLVEDPMRGPTIGGFDNLAVSAKYVFWHDPTHELLLSAGVEAEVGGTGQKRIGADSLSVVSPQLFFG